MKKRLSALLLAALLLLSGCQYAVIEDETTVVSLPVQQMPASTPAPTPEPTPEPTPAPTPLASGAKGQDVSLLQKQLLEYGFMNGKADGHFGPVTDSAVKTFQQYMYDTHGASFAALAPMPTPTASPQTTASVTALPQTTPQPTFSPSGVVTEELKEYLQQGNFDVYLQNLARGDTGSEVKRLQTRLVALQYLDHADGVFGSRTQSAVKYFQKRNKLQQTGVADEATQRLLFSDKALKSDKPKHMYMLKVDTSKQRVYAYEWQNGSYSKQVRSMICSTGTYKNPTPLGTFSSGGRLGRWYYFRKFDCWAQYAYQITGPYYFHSVIYSEKDTSTLRQGSVANLGKRASHGCIRLKVEDAKWIYDNCPAGTTVKIV